MSDNENGGPVQQQGDAAAARAAIVAPPMATFSIKPPEPFDFAKPQEWEKWIRRFERFRLASNLNSSSDANQVNTLVYCMGDEADDVLRGLNLTEEQRQQYPAVKNGFDSFFIPKKNVIYERAKFNRRVQQPTESVDAFITVLYALAENCEYGDLHDELLRDRLVVGIKDLALSERMQLDAKLTLAKAITMARQSEEIKRQQTDLRELSASKPAMDAMHFKRGKQNKFRPKDQAQGQKKNWKPDKPVQNKAENRACGKCGKSPSHPVSQCPAKSADCHNCGKRGHFGKVCRSNGNVHEVAEDVDELFLGVVASGEDPWMADISLRGSTVSFKIDTGADVTAISEQAYKSVMHREGELEKVLKPLYGPGGTKLTVLGSTTETLSYKDRSIAERIYVVRGLQVALLSRPASVSLKLVARVDTIDQESVRQTYPKLCDGLGLVQKPYTIKLKPDAKPFSLKVPRRVPLPLMGKVKKELERMESLGVISRIEEPTDWCCGMVVAPKKNKEEVRICVDMTPLNVSVCREKYILPSVEQTLGMLTGAQYFSKLDANMGFWQIPLAKESALLTTFITPFGRYHFNRLPFGISSAPEHFQNMMVTEVTSGLEGVVCHMDDLLIWGATKPQHDARVHAVLERAEKAGVTLNMSKCEFGKREVKFLGYIISADGMKPDPDKTRAVRDMKVPTNISELRSFLGMVNQLGKFLPNLAEKDKPLRDLLSKKNQWCWGHEQQGAFCSLKEELSTAPVLQLYDPNKPLKISADASSYGLGAVMLQKDSEVWSPVAYASRSLTSTEQRYAQLEKEALALTWACERFSDFILGLHFDLETDHKPLVSLLGGQALDALPPRIQRFRMRLMRYSYTISYTPGKSLTTADTLSRAPLTNGVVQADNDLMEDTNIYVDSLMDNLPTSDKYLSELREQLCADSVCALVMKYCVEGWPDRHHLQGPVKHYWHERAHLSVHNGLLLRGTRLVIPASMRNNVLEKIHEGHQGVVKCRERARQTVWWPGLSSQISELVLNCRDCIKERVNPREPLLPTNLPDGPWQKLGTDLFTLKEKTYLLVVDYFSRYVEIAQLSPTRSSDVIVHLKSMFSRHGVPFQLLSDNGPQYSGHEMKQFAADYGFEHVTSSPKYPQGNSEAERAVQTVKNLLKKAKDPYLALMAYRATPLSNGYSPAQLLMGRRLRTTLPILPEKLQPALPDLQALQHKERERRLMDAKHFDERHRARALAKLIPGDQVWITDTKAQGTVTSIHPSPRSYVVCGPQGTLRRNRQHLVPMPGSQDENQPEQGDIPPRASSGTLSSPKPSQSTPSVLRTKSGREVKKPQRLDL